MPPLYQQRAELIQVNTDLLIQWLELVDKKTQRQIIESMVHSYKLPQLCLVRAHLLEEITKAKAKQKKERHTMPFSPSTQINK